MGGTRNAVRIDGAWEVKRPAPMNFSEIEAAQGEEDLDRYFSGVADFQKAQAKRDDGRSLQAGDLTGEVNRYGRPN